MGILCPGGYNEVDGCKLPDECRVIPLSCPQECPKTCLEGELQCSAFDKLTQCEVHTCVQKVLGNNNEICPQACPSTCKENDILCPGGYDLWSGCPNPAMCRHIPDNCPQECPKACEKGQMHCTEDDPTS